MSNNMGTLFIIAAPSGGGKTSLVNAVLDMTPDILVSVSHTTRKRRPGEHNDVNYHFVSLDVFEDMVGKNAFLEHANVFGNYYGTSYEWVKSTLADGKDVILEIDWQGARQVRERLEDTVLIFILPPSLTTLRERLEHRDQDDPQVINTRMNLAQQEMIHYKEFDYIVINDNFDQAAMELRSIIVSRRLKRSRQEVRHSKLIKSLLS